MVLIVCKVVSYTPDEIRNMEESARIRVESQPVKLIQMVRFGTHFTFDFVS